MRQWIKQQIERRWGIVIVDRAEYYKLRNNASYLSLLQRWAEDTGIKLPLYSDLVKEEWGKVILKSVGKLAANIFEQPPTLSYLRGKAKDAPEGKRIMEEV